MRQNETYKSEACSNKKDKKYWEIIFNHNNNFLWSDKYVFTLLNKLTIGKRIKVTSLPCVLATINSIKLLKITAKNRNEVFDKCDYK